MDTLDIENWIKVTNSIIPSIVKVKEKIEDDSLSTEEMNILNSTLESIALEIEVIINLYANSGNYLTKTHSGHLPLLCWTNFHPKYSFLNHIIIKGDTEKTKYYNYLIKELDKVCNLILVLKHVETVPIEPGSSIVVDAGVDVPVDVNSF